MFTQNLTIYFIGVITVNLSTKLGNFIKQFDAEIYKSFILERYKSGESGYSNFKEPKFDSIKSPKFGKVKRQDFEHAEWYQIYQIIISVKSMQ